MGEHRRHLPKETLNKAVQVPKGVSQSRLKQAARGQGGTTKEDAKEAKQKSLCTLSTVTAHRGMVIIAAAGRLP